MPVLLFLQATNVGNERFDFLFRNFLSVTRHLTLAIHDGIKYAFVAHAILPFGVGKISSVGQFSFERFGSPISTMTRGTIFRIQLRGAPTTDMARLTERVPCAPSRDYAAKAYSKEDD